MTVYLYTHACGEATFDTLDEALAARDRNNGRGFIFRVVDGVKECVA